MGTLSSLTTCFLALRPHDAFAATVLNYKRRAERRIGPQLYLDDPPHLTLYLASFSNVAALNTAVREVALGLRTPTAMVRGWHVFQNDPLNGNHTLVCDIDPAHRHDLATCQQRVCEAMWSLRDPGASMARYAPFWANLSDAARANVTQWGFPFVGSIWHPHVSIASIRPADWDPLWSELENDPPGGTVRFPELCLYALEDGRPVLLERFDLESLS